MGAEKVSNTPVVVGVDGSDDSAEALRWAIQYATADGAPITAVHAFSPWVGTEMSIPPFDYQRWKDSIDSDFREIWSKPLLDSKVPYRQRLLEAEPAPALLQIAEEEDAQLIVIGRHGHSRWSPHLLGGITAKVLHRSNLPVAVVPEGASKAAAPRNVVVGVDGTPEGQLALDWAATHLRAPDLEIVAACAYSLVAWSPQPPLAAGEDGVDGLIARLTAVTKATGASTGVDIRPEVVVGSPTEALLVASKDASMLVVGSRPRSLLTALMSASTSHACALHAACPVIVVPSATNASR